jgi:endoglucanase
MLKTKNNTIVDSKGRKVFLHGVNLGGWLMMEGYILHGRNIAERIFKAEFKKRWGQKELDSFTKLYRNNFITEADFKNISSLGFNCIRLPFNYRLIEKEDGLKILKKAVSLCEKYRIYCILDMHAAPGSQNEDWHSDSDGKAELWGNKAYQEKFFKLWELLAGTFKDKQIVAGYDVLNESVIKTSDASKKLRGLYVKLVKRIRAIDKNHIIFLEGNLWGQRLEDIGSPFADNLSYSIHYYPPLEFTFNFYHGLKYPGDIMGEYWDADTIRKQLKGYYNYSKKWKVPIFTGEFGVTSRYPAGCCGELAWVKDTLKCFKEFGFHWTYWTYKAVGNNAFPDGIYQYLGNPLWVNRQGPVYGFENFYGLWKKHKKEIAESWKTKNFTENKALSNLLASFKSI